MSQTKRLLEDISVWMGYKGAINSIVIHAACELKKLVEEGADSYESAYDIYLSQKGSINE